MKNFILDIKSKIVKILIICFQHVEQIIELDSFVASNFFFHKCVDRWFGKS